MLAQLPQLAPGELERWIISASAVGAMVLLGIRLFGRRNGNGNGNGNAYCKVEEFRLFRSSVETQVELLRDRIDSRHLALIQKLEELHEATGQRLAQVEGAVQRLDERTRNKLRVES